MMKQMSIPLASHFIDDIHNDIIISCHDINLYTTNGERERERESIRHCTYACT
jgi:hypothetical protein